MTTLIIATRNEHKTEEIKAILGKRLTYFSLKDFPAVPAIVEDGKTFEANAVKKAIDLSSWLVRHPRVLFSKIADQTPLYILADDSGLEVDAIDGAPGVYSARFAAIDSGFAGNSPDSANNAKLLRLLERASAEKRTARFRCVLAFTHIPYGELAQKPLISTSDGLRRFTQTVEGTCEGKIAFEPSGKCGFGYDPLFIPKGFTRSFAELGETEKNKISHRAQALQKLREKIK